MNEWIKGLPQVATEKDLKTKWGFRLDNFRCGICGYKFKLGDYWRFLYSNGTKGTSGNIFVCKECDGDDVMQKYIALVNEWKNLKNGKFWKLSRVKK